ncbi:TetR family transcriptional regulator [Hydrococcus rivularis NIES-593]|uniref:TetR family transcriptional regulator n=1 Tax=Hydrococcus rivularis NIES-593 TaxID=1921803 RepID=A0A1U7HBW4_9CYAN|nr:TetR/AcrR family transcriptional regulator [Hydrococcus rivularis]OKH21054.1 TetR family transcriptional regulator [Hydrococcus rivularis NIES-593]
MQFKKNYHHGDLRQALIDTAIELIAERGMSDWSLREVARRIGVSHTAPYRHFADREALLAAVAEKGFQEMSNYLLQTLEKIPNEHSQRLQSIGVAYVQYAIAHPCEYEVMFRYSQKDKRRYPALSEAATTAFMVLVNVIVEGQKAGAFRAENPKGLAWVAWSLVHGLAMLLVDGQLQVPENSTVETLASFTTQMLTEGLQADR